MGKVTGAVDNKAPPAGKPSQIQNFPCEIMSFAKLV